MANTYLTYHERKKESICAYTVQCDMHIFFNSNRKIKLVSSFPLVRELCSNGGECDETLICQQASNRMTLAFHRYVIKISLSNLNDKVYR